MAQVLALFAVDATNSVFNVVFIYVCLVLHFGDADYLKVTNWQFATGDGASFERGRILLNYTRGGNVGPTLTAVIALMVQLFFTWRVYVLTRNRLLVVIVGLLALASAVCGCLTTWEVIAIPQFARFQNFRQKHKTGFRGSDMVVDRIIRLTVQTGLATSIVATVDLTLYLASTSGIHLLFNFALCKLYSNSLMSSLNSRNRWRRHIPASEIIFTEGPRQPDNPENPENPTNGS
ncbi:hypothetical protein AGABI2DRAFT_119069 [Agaricus bisporus var. bisporus H97]|uniref:hypothetical protein n=1 Tax=Agaricus bisporus var. bisporus (strain H97 / ATCC MYA-4626 / FGSC 10389) TaxID=936046 RepID=UPI00029F6ECA|nr:hypothetical protein AGABI2DRAFT_119069 [Agaricus bisporus var. bisporus H97]EKV46892.1 hypothetical protein AGABI2DRAFT_119069 [Agaricus bisporus var. bisporus H97]